MNRLQCRIRTILAAASAPCRFSEIAAVLGDQPDDYVGRELWAMQKRGVVRRADDRSGRGKPALYTLVDLEGAPQRDLRLTISDAAAARRGLRLDADEVAALAKVLAT